MSSPLFMYHFDHPSTRLEIASKGLLAKDPGWADQPVGVYLLDFDPRTDPLAKELGLEPVPTAGDLYQVRVDGLTLLPGKVFPHAFYVTTDIPLSRITKIELVERELL